MKCELESRNDGVMAVAPVADNYIPAKWCQAKECDKFKFLVPGPGSSVIIRFYAFLHI